MQASLVLVLLLVGWEGGTCFAGQSQSEEKQNQSKCEITFDTPLKSALITSNYDPSYFEVKLL